MPTGSARQRLTVFVEAGGELEHYPGLVIPYRDAEVYQTTDVFLEKGARFGMLERWSMGRVAFGEAFRFRHLSSRLRIYREGRLVYTDGLKGARRAEEILGTWRAAYALAPLRLNRFGQGL